MIIEVYNNRTVAYKIQRLFNCSIFYNKLPKVIFKPDELRNVLAKYNRKMHLKPE
jgi:hypothetical protein